MKQTRATTVLTGDLADAMTEETISVIRCLTRDLVDRISDIFLTAVVLDKLDPKDFAGEKLAIIISLEPEAK